MKITAKLSEGINLQDIFKYKSRQAKRANHKPIAYVATMPKSAGTFICKTIADRHLIPYLHFTDRQGCCEFDIYHPSLLNKIREGGIVHQHTLGSEGNIYYLCNYNIPCIVLTRNIYDALYSFYEHLEKYKNTWPIFESPAGYFNMSCEEKISFLITVAAPWMLQFYISWYKAQQEKKIEILWLTYESFMKDKIKAINNIETLLRIPVPQQLKDIPLPHVNEALRFNKGIPGRGVAFIREEQKQKIQSMMSFYPEVDFSIII